MKRITIILSLLLVVQLFAVPLLSAQDADDEENVTSSTSVIELQISSLPEAKLLFNQKFKFPFLAGSGALTKGNNIAITLTGEVTPITLGLIAEVVWTPIAFLQAVIGGRAGTGWKVNLFGGELYGIGFNREDGGGLSEWYGNGFKELQWEAYAGGVFQFDFAAIFPGDWHHVVLRTYHEVGYRGNSAGGPGDSWYFENDDGENMNGFDYYGNFLVGYQMPIFWDTVGILTEMELYLYDTPNREDWGDNLIRWKFALVNHFSIGKKFGIAVLVQFRTVRNYNEANWKELYYQNRTLDTSNKLSFKFYRVAGLFSYKF